jgi:hypothetical protein
MLGHADIGTTNTYLNASRTSLQEAMRKVDEARRCNPVANEPTTEPRSLGNGAEENADKPLVN